MKKIVTSVFFMVVAYVGIPLSSIWAIVGFILYLVKDTPFNWWSIWSFLICIFMFLVNIALTVVFAHNLEQEENKKEIKVGVLKKSAFTQRMEKMIEQKRGL